MLHRDTSCVYNIVESPKALDYHVDDFVNLHFVRDIELESFDPAWCLAVPSTALFDGSLDFSESVGADI